MSVQLVPADVPRPVLTPSGPSSVAVSLGTDWPSIHVGAMVSRVLCIHSRKFDSSIISVCCFFYQTLTNVVKARTTVTSFAATDWDHSHVAVSQDMCWPLTEGLAMVRMP